MPIDYETPVTETGTEVPEWIDQDITVGDVREIGYAGCASGAYMPAVTYTTALAVMGTYGDEVMDYIDSVMGLDQLPQPDALSWSGLAVYYLSAAVELWAQGLEELVDNVEAAE